ncbi:MAG TPA: SDR family NAD(P)-dependent oxidoreductase [Acidimicrobiales bacterium]|nr:SDR family NAD(P)-dependent oxidoreductase [Acidimicrobiales bacterium]
MDMRFDGKVVLVTGASGGIGAAVAREFGASGASVAVHYATGESAAASVVESVLASGGHARAHRVDLTDPEGPGQLVAAVSERFGRIDVLVNNAGGQVRRASVVDTGDDLYDELVALNLTSLVRMCRAAIPVIARGGGGSIVNVSSVSARTGGGGGSVVYSAAKAAVSTLTRGLAKELVPAGIRVNAVAPGLVDTAFHAATPSSTWDTVVAGIPMGRAGRPEEIVGPVLFLACEATASYVNGQSLEVNGAQYSP